MKKKKISFVSLFFIITISFSLGFFADILVGFFNKNLLNVKQTSLINTGYGIIQKYAIDDYEGDYVVDFALKGMAASLDDNYAYYFTAEEFNEYMKSANGTVEGGLGATLQDDSDEVVISEVYKGLSAETAGLKAGDVIVGIDNENVSGLNASEISRKSKGESGTTVKITVKRNGKELSFNVERTDGQRELVEYRMIGKLLYTRIISFHGNAVECFEKALEFGESNGYEGIIMDLRDNPGGDVDVFSEIADKLLKEGEIFYALDKNGNKIRSESSDEKSVEKPISVIVNGSSASASEAMAGALRDLGGAKIVGTKTFGKGIMQTNFELTNGGMFKLTTARYFLPNGDCIHGEGIEPHYVIELPDDLNTKVWLRNDKNDTQLQKAIEVLTN